MLKSIFFSILSLVGMISFEFWAFADDLQIEHANIIGSKINTKKYCQLRGALLTTCSLSFDENLSLKAGIKKALNAKKHELLNCPPIIKSEKIPGLVMEPIEIEFIKKSSAPTSSDERFGSTLDPSIWLKTPKELGLTGTLTSNDYTVNISMKLETVYINNKKALVSMNNRKALLLRESQAQRYSPY